MEAPDFRYELLTLGQLLAGGFLVLDFDLIPEFQEQEETEGLQPFRCMQSVVAEDVGDFPQLLAKLIEIRCYRHFSPPFLRKRLG